jgi:hypothetical protein
MPDIPVQTSPPAPEGTKKGLPRWLKIVGAVIAFIVLVLIIITLIPVPLEGNVQPEFRNEQVYAALAANGITDAAVDVTADRVLVSAVVQDPTNAPKVKYIVYGAISQLDSPPPIIIVEVFDKDNKPAGTSSIQTSAVTDYVNGKITLDQLDSRVQALA